MSRISSGALYTCLTLILAVTATPFIIRNRDNQPEYKHEADVESKPSDFKLAAAQNAKLVKELEWVFGSKQQRGWYIYLPLIDQLIGTEKAPDSSEFAAALSRWQKLVGAPPDGVVDTSTLMRMISVWQSRRTYDHIVPPAERLITAPPSDYLYPSRPEELRKIERETFAAYKRMVAAAIRENSLGLAVSKDGGLADSEQFLKLISTFRSPQYQEELRRRSPNAGSAGLAKNSPHFTGRAIDLYVGGDPVDTTDQNRALQTQTRVYKWLVKNAGSFGFRPYFYEPWHWEYDPQNLK